MTFWCTFFMFSFGILKLINLFMECLCMAPLTLTVMDIILQIDSFTMCKSGDICSRQATRFRAGIYESLIRRSAVVYMAIL